MTYQISDSNLYFRYATVFVLPGVGHNEGDWSLSTQQSCGLVGLWPCVALRRLLRSSTIEFVSARSAPSSRPSPVGPKRDAGLESTPEHHPPGRRIPLRRQ